MIIINSLTFSRPYGVDDDFFIPLFFEIKENKVSVNNTQELLVQMFYEQAIFLTKVIIALKETVVGIITLGSFQIITSNATIW